MSRSRRSRASAPAFPSLGAGTQQGLRLLVADNTATVAAMLDAGSGDSSVEALCEKCAGVLKQQQLSPESFLARFFEAGVLGPHAVKLGKSGKGSSATLAARIATAWARNANIPAASEPSPEKRKLAQGQAAGGAKKAKVAGATESPLRTAEELNTCSAADFEQQVALLFEKSTELSGLLRRYDVLRRPPTHAIQTSKPPACACLA